MLTLEVYVSYERYSSCQPTDMELLTSNLGEPVGLRTVEVMELLECSHDAITDAGQQKLKSLRKTSQVDLVLIPLDVYHSCN